MERCPLLLSGVTGLSFTLPLSRSRVPNRSTNPPRSAPLLRPPPFLLLGLPATYPSTVEVGLESQTTSRDYPRRYYQTGEMREGMVCVSREEGSTGREEEYHQIRV